MVAEPGSVCSANRRVLIIKHWQCSRTFSGLAVECFELHGDFSIVYFSSPEALVLHTSYFPFS